MRAVAVGNFDGVHIAHGMLIKETAEYARGNGLNACVLTLDPNPKSILSASYTALISKADKLKEISALGVREILVQSVDRDFLNLTAEEFFKTKIVGELNAKFVAVGYNYRFGRRAGAGVAELRELCGLYGINLFVLPEQKVGGVTVSSSGIKEYAAAGDIEKLNGMLGREFYVVGEVMHGKRLGRVIGFPTINMRSEFVVPKNGVYETRTHIMGREYGSVTNVGVNPTVGANGVQIETHVPGFSGDIYGMEVRVDFVRRLRDERKFENLEELKRQIKADVECVLKTAKKA